MKTARLFLLLCLWGLPQAGWSQASVKKVTLSYSGQPLGYILDDISRRYDVRFAYSSSFFPVDHRISIQVRNQPLTVALDELFMETPVVYRYIGGQVVLKVDPSKTMLLRSRQEEMSYEGLSPAEREAFLAELEAFSRDLALLDNTSIGEVDYPGGDRWVAIRLEQFRLPVPEKPVMENPDNRLAQVSFLPFLGTNAMQSSELTNNLSFNVLWGINGGVNGVEIAGMFNSITNDMHGVQVAGLGNMVGGEVLGTQVSGLFNISEGKTTGVQVAGGFNLAREAEAVQVALFFNVTRNHFSGVQASGFFNWAGKTKDAVQVAGLMNTTSGEVKTQVAGLFNLADEVGFNQFSAGLNIAKKVSGVQVGLVNVADTVGGASFGLLNFIKKGYNRLEVSGSDALYGNLAIKLGVKRFYNILLIGARWDERNLISGSGRQNGIYMSWGLGYGLGTAITFNPKWLMNIELLSIHINETEGWTDELNQLNQIRLLLDWQTGNKVSFFAGPVGNVMVSRRFDPQTENFGSLIRPDAWYNKTSGNTNVRMWVGVQAGIRF